MLNSKLFVPGAQLQSDGDAEGVTIFTRAKEAVDIWLLMPQGEGDQEFSGYYLTHCIGPDHKDTARSMLVYHDGVRCQACGFKADAVDLFQMRHPELGTRQCAEKLLADPELVLDRSLLNTGPKETRQLDQNLAISYHLALTAEAIVGLMGFGFTKASILRFKLGWARVLVRLDENELDPFAEYPNLEQREKGLYQWQWRYSVPVFEGERLRQVIYRKADPRDPGPKTTLEYQAGTAWLYNGAALDGQEFGVFASGWGDVIVLSQWGIPAACGISGDGHFRPEWKDRLARLKRPYSVTDADQAGEKLRAKLNTDIPWIRHIELPYELGTKKDVRDYLLEGHTGDDFRQVMRKADIAKSFIAFRRGQ